MLHRIETLQQRKIQYLGQLQAAVILLVLAVQRRLTKLRGAPAKHIIMATRVKRVAAGISPDSSAGEDWRLHLGGHGWGHDFV